MLQPSPLRKKINYFIFMNAIALFLTCSSCISYAAETLHVKIPPVEPSAPTSIYYSKLLELALSKTQATDGPFDITAYSHQLTKARFEAELAHNGVVNVVWSVTSNELEAHLLPIRISLLKDLNSYRIFLIRKEDQPLFDHVKSLEDLRALKAGQGSHWRDTDVLLANNLPVVTSPQFEPLFGMLLGKRFDYFPRGLDEVWNEEKLYAEKGLITEQHLMLHYRSPKYFFVNKHNTALADRIERGLRIAIADGSFDSLLYNTTGYKRGYDEIHSNKRLIFSLKSNDPHF